MGITPNMGTPKEFGITGMPMPPDMAIIGIGCIGTTGEPIGAPGSAEAPYTVVGVVYRAGGACVMRCVFGRRRWVAIEGDEEGRRRFVFKEWGHTVGGASERRAQGRAEDGKCGDEGRRRVGRRGHHVRSVESGPELAAASWLDSSRALRSLACFTRF